MADRLTKEERSRMMSKIRSRNTKPELITRRSLHRFGFRFRINQKNIEGHPDIVLKKYNTIIFVHGCFWHGHDCQLFRLPKSNRGFWKKKIENNRLRDLAVKKNLSKTQWRVKTLWECSIRGKKDKDVDKVIKRLASWIKLGESKKNPMKII